MDERAIDAEVIGGQQPFYRRLRQQCRQKPRRDGAFDKPVTVLRENRVIPHRLVDADSDEPAEQEIELEPLHQLTLRAH